MKHTFSRRICAVLSVILMLTVLLTAAVSAADSASREIDPNMKGTLVIKEKETESASAIAGLEVLLYKIGDIDAENVKVVPAADYADAKLDFSDLSTVEKQLAQAKKAQAFIEDKKIEDGFKTLTDDKGEARFEGLSVGLYLVVFDGEASSIPGAFLIQMPNYSDEKGGYEYDITAAPKSPAEDRFISRTVTKVWADNDNKAGKRTKSIKVSLIRDGKTDVPYETVELNDANKWTYTWDNLDKGAKWTVVEEGIPAGYVSKTAYDGDKITITNTYTEGKLPQTGQNYTIVLVLAAVGVALVVVGTTIYCKTNKKKQH